MFQEPTDIAHQCGSGSRETYQRRQTLPRRSDLPDSSRSPYAPGAIRSSSDREQALIAGFLERHAEYERLSASELVVLAETYRDDEDLSLRADMADQGVDLAFDREAVEIDAPAWSDEGFISGQFVLFVVGAALLMAGLFAHPSSGPGMFLDLAAILLGAGLIGIAIGDGDDSEVLR